jgi:hypothetical protein
MLIHAIYSISSGFFLEYRLLNQYLTSFLNPIGPCLGLVCTILDMTLLLLALQASFAWV